MIGEQVDNPDRDVAGAVIQIASGSPIMFPPSASGLERIGYYHEDPQDHWAAPGHGSMIIPRSLAAKF